MEINAGSYVYSASQLNSSSWGFGTGQPNPYKLNHSCTGLANSLYGLE